MAYGIEIRASAQKQILSLPAKARLTVARAIDQLVETPRPYGCKKLRGTGLWRLRIGHYRVVYAIDDGARLLTLVKVAARREDTYR